MSSLIPFRREASFLPPILLVAVCLLAGCERASSGEPPSGALVRNDERGAWKTGQAWRLTEQLRIGSATSGGADMFGRVADLAVDRLGRIWVADAQASEIRLFGADGRHVRTIGRKGAGPGEFGGIAGMDWSPDGKLWVLDGGLSRYTVFDTTGALVATHQRAAGIVTTPWPGGFDREGRLYDLAPVQSTDGSTGQAVIRLDADLQPSDTFKIPEFEGEYFELVSPDGSSRNKVGVPFAGSQVWRLDPDGDVWLANTDRYRLFRLNFNGDTVRGVEREYTPVRVTGADVERILESFEWFTDQGGKVDRSRIPDVMPAFDTFFFSEDGHLWVVPTRAGGERVAFDVFDREGRYLGRVHSPTNILSAPTPVVGDDYVVAVMQDDLGVQSVVRLRIEKS